MFLRAMRCVWQGVSVVSHTKLYKRIQKRTHNRIHKGMHNNGTTAGQRRDNPGTTRHPDGQTLRQSDPMEADGTSSGLCYNNDHTLNAPCSGGLLLAFFPRRRARSTRRRGLGAVRDWRVAKRKQGHVTVKRLRTRPNGKALGVVVAPVRTTRVAALLRRGGRSFISKNLRGITQTPCPLRRRCRHNQAHRLHMQGRGSVPASAYEGIEVKHAQG